MPALPAAGTVKPYVGPTGKQRGADSLRDEREGVARASSEERIHSATSEWGGSAKRVGGRIHQEWRAPLHEKGAALPPRPTTVELVV